jgi:hypothetical protein
VGWRTKQREQSKLSTAAGSPEMPEGSGRVVRALIPSCIPALAGLRRVVVEAEPSTLLYAVWTGRILCFG